MPVVDYATWYRMEQEKRGRNPRGPDVGVTPPRQQPNLKPSAVQEILASPIGRQGVEELGKQVYNYLNPATTATQTAAQAGTQAATQAGTQAATQAAATEAGKQAAAQGASQGAAQAGASTGASAASALGTAASVVGAAKGSYDLYKGIEEKRGAKSTTMSGAAAGAAIGSLIPGVGTLVGAAVGALVGATAGALRPPPSTQKEDKRWRILARQGFDVPQWVKEGIDIKDSGFRKDLAPDFVGVDEKGTWVNNKFAKSRKESDLTAQDISQYAVMPETFGTLWAGASPEAQQQVAQLAADRAKLREHKGTLDIEWDEGTKRFAQDILAGNDSGYRPKMWVPPTERYVPPSERRAPMDYELMGPQVPYQQMNPYMRGRR